MAHKGDAELEVEWAAALADAPAVGSEWHHLKTGKVYAVVGHYLRESDDAPCVRYRRSDSAAAGRVVPEWGRPLYEFTGRYVPVPPEPTRTVAGLLAYAVLAYRESNGLRGPFAALADEAHLATVEKLAGASADYPAKVEALRQLGVIGAAYAAAIPADRK